MYRLFKNDDIDKEIENRFNDARDKIDLMFKYSKLTAILEQYLEKRTWTYNEALIVDEKLPELKAISLKYSYIIPNVNKLNERIAYYDDSYFFDDYETLYGTKMKMNNGFTMKENQI